MTSDLMDTFKAQFSATLLHFCYCDENISKALYQYKTGGKYCESFFIDLGTRD